MTVKRTRIGEIGRAFKERGGKYEMRINYSDDIEDDAEDIDSNHRSLKVIIGQYVIIDNYR